MSLKLSLAAAFGLGISAPALAQEIHILDTYARAASPMAKTGAAFMLIENIGTEADRLIGATSPAAKKVEFHTHREENGVMKMVHVEEGFELAAGEILFLERGGNHVMLMGLTEPFEQGKTIQLTLVFEKSGEIEVEVPVDLARKPDASGDSHDHGHSD